MSDIVGTFRSYALDKDNFPRMDTEVVYVRVGLLTEAADRIEQLEAELEQCQNTLYRQIDLTIQASEDATKASADRIEQLEAALKPLCCTCDRAASDECSRAEVNCAFWNARAVLGASDDQ